MKISVAVPVYNEEKNIKELYSRLIQALTDFEYELVFVNDGSKDSSFDKLRMIAEKDKSVKAIDLSRNFGKEIALTAALDNCTGDLIVPIDADLQDPPELIPDLIKKINDGFDVVYAKRTDRDGESWMKKFTSFWFYRVLRKLTDIYIPEDTGDFRIMRREVLDAIKQVRENNRFMKGIFAWVGFKQTYLEYHREARKKGKTKWNYWKLVNLAIEGITSFSYVPLRFSSFIGFLVSVGAAAYAIFLIIYHFLGDSSLPGYSSIMVAVLFLGGIQLMSLGVIGEYLGRTYYESKKRPLYFVREKISSN